MIKVFFVKDASLILNEEDAKMVGFKLESSQNMGMEKEGYYFWFNADEEFYQKEFLKKEGVKEVTGEEKEKVLEAFERIEEEKMAGIGGLF